MHLRPRHILVFLILLPALLSCAGKVRRIPERTFAKITRDMLLADAWLGRHPEANQAADTTYLYDAVFENYGYSFEDYDSTVRYYMANPDKYVQVTDLVKELVEKKIASLESERDTVGAEVAPEPEELSEKDEPKELGAEEVKFDDIEIDSDKKTKFEEPESLKFEFDKPKIRKKEFKLREFDGKK